MFEKFRVIFTIPELRQKIFLTLLFLAIYRVGWQIPLPVVNQEAMTAHFESGELADIFAAVSVFSASQLNQATIFGLGIMPYISASIIFQLLGSVWKPLEELKKRGGKRPEENQRVHTICHCYSLPLTKLFLSALANQRIGGHSESGSAINQRSGLGIDAVGLLRKFWMATSCSTHDDCRHCISYVAR
jgi:preprotein translocase subunit SecY